MPNWNKVVVSGSNASLNSLTVSNGITGSLLGTASYATTAQNVIVSPSSSAAIVDAAGFHKFYPLFGAVRIDGNYTNVSTYVNSGSFQYIMGTNTLTVTSSYANQALTASFALNGGGGGSSFPFTGSAQITGSLGVTGSFNQASASLASGLFAHAQGFNVTASGAYSHAEGNTTTAAGIYSHAEGASTVASGRYSHAEGRNTTASGNYSHAEGISTVAEGDYQHVQGQYNLSSLAQSAFIVGNGTGTGSLRSNLIFASGSQVQITGSVIATAGFTGSLLGTATTASYVLNAVSASRAVSSSFASTASFTPNAIVTASVSSNTITFTKGNGTTFPITVNTGSGGGATSPGGSTTEIQYNNAGAFAGTSTLTFDGTTITANPITATGYFIPQNALGGLSTVGANYTISNPGVYRFTGMDSGGAYYINFPDPASKPDGQTIIIINADTTYAGYYDQTYNIQDPSGTAITLISTSQADTFVNMEGIWIRTSRRP